MGERYDTSAFYFVAISAMQLNILTLTTGRAFREHASSVRLDDTLLSLVTLTSPVEVEFRPVPGST